MTNVHHAHPLLPTDIVAAVFDELTRDAEDRGFLASCRLVSREWDSVARPLFFKTVSISFNPCRHMRMVDVLDFLREHRTIAGHVRSLSVTNICWTDRWPSGTSFHFAALVTMGDLYELIGAVPNLLDLCLNGVCPSGDIPIDSAQLKLKYPLRRLYINLPFGGSSRTNLLSDILSIFQSVGVLSINGYDTFDSREVRTTVQSSSEPTHSHPVNTLITSSLADDQLLLDPNLLTCFQNVRNLKLGHVNVSSDGTPRLNRLLKHLTSLETLEIMDISNRWHHFGGREPVVQLDLSPCSRLTRMRIHLTFVTLPCLIWSDLTGALLAPLTKPRALALEVQIFLDVTALLSICPDEIARVVLLESTEYFADTISRATDAGSVSRVVVQIFTEESEGSFGDAVGAMRRAFADKVSPLAGSCKLEVQ